MISALTKTMWVFYGLGEAMFRTRKKQISLKFIRIIRSVGLFVRCIWSQFYYWGCRCRRKHFYELKTVRQVKLSLWPCLNNGPAFLQNSFEEIIVNDIEVGIVLEMFMTISGWCGGAGIGAAIVKTVLGVGVEGVHEFSAFHWELEMQITGLPWKLLKKSSS